MPDFDALFPAQAKNKNFDALFPQQNNRAQNYGENTGDTVQDLIFGDTSRNPVARLMDAFGEGFSQAWGSEPLGLSDKTNQWLRDVGMFNDYKKGQYGIVRAGNEALIRPAATALDAIWRAGGAVFRGSQATVAQAGEETGHPLLGRELAAIPEAFPMGTAAVVGEAPSLLATARDMRIIGQGEAGWKGTKAAAEEAKPPEMPQPTVQATGTPTEPQAQPGVPPPAPTPAPAVSNLHSIVRQDNPDLFAKYDPLTEQQVQLRMWIDEGIDTGAARTRLSDVDKQLTDLAPQVQEAYRTAADQANAPTVSPQFNSMAQMLASQGEAAKSIEAQRTFIANDVTQKLIAAGRPTDEAQEAGTMIAARYETRAARFNGALGTPEELYRTEGAEIRGAGTTPTGGVGSVPPTPTAPTGGIDATHDVVTGANSAKEPNGTVFIDKHIPEFSPALKDDRGNPVNLHNMLELHERVEADEMAAGVPYAEAHEAATDAERLLANKTGIDFDAYTKEMDGFLEHVEKEKPENPPDVQLHVQPEQALEKHTSKKKKTNYGEATMPQYLRHNPLENAEQYRLNEKFRREKYGAGGGGKVYMNAAQEAADRGMTVKEANEAFAAAQREHGEAFDAMLKEEGLTPADVPDDVRHVAIEAMQKLDKNARDALDYADRKVEEEAQRNGDLDAMLDKEGVYFQKRKASRDLIAEREAEGQMQIPGMDRINQAELVQRRANEPLKPTVARKPMDEGLFSDQVGQKDLFQNRLGRVRLVPGQRPIITMGKSADASTIIHEQGHVFLEEMKRDAAHPQAPDLVRSDWDTTRKWLGMEENENIARRHHEKFAKGFEQYLREGVAPSAPLARVFAQFRDWLLHIYESIRTLGAPINDDIRGVFDRLLAEKPERTVIAPELARRPTLSDIHEADAALTPAEGAEAAADRITAETARYEAGLPGGVADEHARTASETGLGEPQRGALPETGGAAEPVAPSGVGGPQSGPEPPGGGNAVPEGAKAQEKPVAATAPLTRSEDRFIDKAGNIRLDNLGTPEDVNAVIREAADRNDNFLPERRGIVSDQQVLDLADALGMTPEELNRRRIGQAFNAEQVMAARKLLIQSAQAVRDAAAKAADGSDAEVLAYAQAADRHRMIQGQVSGITAEAGRALRAFRSIGEGDQTRELGAMIQEATGRTLFQLRATAKKIANLDTTQQVSKLVRDSERTGLFDWLQALFVNALISGPFTHAGYTTAGEIYALFRAVGETGASAAVGAVRRALGVGESEYAHIGEMPHQLYGMFAGARNGVKNAWASIKSNQVVLPPEVEQQMNLGVTGQTVGTREVIPNPTIAGAKIPIGTAIEAPGRFVAALHSFNWTTFYSQSIAGLAFRQAMHEGLEGQTFANRVAMLTANPSLEMIEEASRDANAGALMQRPDYDTTMGLVSRLTNIGLRVPDIPLPGGRSIPMGTLRPLKYIDPFVQIQANIQRTAFMRGTPLALFHQAVRDDLSGKNGGVAFDRTAGRILAGTGFMIAAGSLAAEGLLNHSGPSDPKESREWQRVFGLPHGLRIGEMSYDVLRLGNLGLQMSVAADLYHAYDQVGKEDASRVSSDLVYAFAQNIIDESSMRGPAEILQAVDEHDRYGERWIQNFVSSFTPFSVGMSQVARQVDPYSRYARTTMDTIKAKIPFESETLMPRRDVWGEPVPNRGWLGTYRQAIANDPVDQTLYPLHIYPSLPGRNIRGVKLTDQQYDDYSRIAGRDAKMRLNALVSMPGFAQMPVEPKVNLINRTIDAARERARNLMMMRYPDIIEQAIAAKRAKAQGVTLH